MAMRPGCQAISEQAEQILNQVKIKTSSKWVIDETMVKVNPSFQELDSASGLPVEAGCTTLNAREPSLSEGSDSFTPQVRLACEFLRALILSVERSGGQC